MRIEVRKCLSFAAIAFLTFSLQAIASTSDPQATLRIKIVSQSGNDLGIAEVTSLRRIYPAIDRERRAEFKGNVMSGLPYGTYRIRLHAKGFRTVEREVQIYQPEVWAVLQLQIGEEGGPSLFDVNGHITMAEPTDDSVWMRLVGIYSNFVFDAKADQTGAFKIGGVPLGDYILFVRVETHVLEIRRVHVPAPEAITIQLSKRKP